jgi:hypothetical protein
MDAPWSGRGPGSVGGGRDPGADDLRADEDADVLVDVLHRVGRCSLQSLLGQPELAGWSPGRLEQAVARAWSGGLVFVDRNDDLVAL